MKTYNVILAKAAAKELDHLTPQKRLELLREIKTLEEAPFPRGGNIIKKLKGIKEAVYRLRVGDYRVIYLIAEETVQVMCIVDRKDLEKKLRNLFG